MVVTAVGGRCCPAAIGGGAAAAVGPRASTSSLGLPGPANEQALVSTHATNVRAKLRIFPAIYRALLFSHRPVGQM